MNWTEIVLGGLTLLGGCAWFVNFRKDKQEAKGIRADNRQKDMNRRTSERRGQAGLDYPEREGGNAKRNLSKMYVDEFNLNIVVPLTIVDLCRDSAKLMRAWLCARCSIGCSGRWESSGRK